VGAGDLTGQLSVRARFERFPATLKGAFILRGEDANPHQVVLKEANVVGIGLAVSRPMPIAPVTLDVVPHRDVFVPFEMFVSDLEPGWYTMRAELEVDGTAGTFDGGRRFAIAWPRASVRRGTVKVERAVPVGNGKVLVEQVECGGDSVKVHLYADPPMPLTAKLFANGGRLEVLQTEIDETTGRGKVVAYPVMRGQSSLRVELRTKGKGAQGALDVELPP
jgi:hypothetical protein